MKYFIGSYLLVWVSCLGLWIYGAVLSFKASLIIGAVSFVTPLNLVWGAFGLFGKNIPEMLQLWWNLPF